MVPPIRIILMYGAFVGGLYWPTTLACSTIISLNEGTVGQCSPWCSVDWKMKHGWLGSGVSYCSHLMLISHF